MEIKTRKRPWEAKHNWGNKLNPDPFYQTNEWKHTKKLHFNSPPKLLWSKIGGISYTNRYCAQCWKEGKMNSERIVVDHIQRIKDGGSRTDQTNLISLCHYHNNVKDNNKDK